MPNDGVIIYHETYSLTTPAPTITGESGTFSESTGNLSIDSSTGVINVNNSTAGTYTVVYTTNGSCPNTVNNTITVNALDGATFAYSSNSLPQTGTASLTTTPTTSGGVFSAYPSGLSINSSTGEIDLAASTIQSYKIFYETSGAGCPNSSTFDLAVTAAGIANNYSMNFDSASGDYIKSSLLNSLDGLSEMSVSLWIKPSGTSQVAIFLSNPNSLTGSGNFQFAIGLLGNELRFLEGTNSKFFRTTSAPLTYGQWNHVAISYTAPTALIYVNAVAQSTVQNGVPTTLSNADDGLHIGKDRNGFWNVFDGQIDEVAIWNTALTDGTGGTVNQIAEIYNATGTNLTKDLTTVSGSNLIYFNRMGD